MAMADNKVMNNNQAATAAAASLLPVSKDKEKVSPPLPAVPVPVPVDDIKPQHPVLAVLVDVDVKKPPASLLSISPSVTVMPADNNNKTTTPPPPPVAVPILLMVCVWALINAVVFAAGDIATLILNRTPCTKSTCLFWCVALTEAASAELSFLLYGELLCSAAAAPLHMLLTKRTTTTTTSCMRGRWAAAVEALAWVALASTAGMHCMEVASTASSSLAPDLGDTYIFVDVVFSSVCLAVDLLASFLLCCSPRRLELGEHQSDQDGEV